MSYYIECDWCGASLHKREHATLEVKVKRIRETTLKELWAAETKPTRHLCVTPKRHDDELDRMGLSGLVEDGEPSCYERAIAAIRGREVTPPDMGLEWRLVRTPESPQPRPVIADDLQAVLAKLVPKVRYALPRAGITTLEQVTEMTDEQLLRLDGVGQGTVDALRAATVGAAAPPTPSVTPSVEEPPTLEDMDPGDLARLRHCYELADADLALSGATIGALARAGYGLVELRRATDDELLAVPGVGRATVARLRAHLEAKGR